LRLPDDAQFLLSLTRTGRGEGPLELSIKKNKKMGLRLPDDAAIPFSLTRTGRGEWPLEIKIKKKNKKSDFVCRTTHPFHYL
jgi:hypothetical protein